MPSQQLSPFQTQKNPLYMLMNTLYIEDDEKEIEHQYDGKNEQNQLQGSYHDRNDQHYEQQIIEISSQSQVQSVESDSLSSSEESFYEQYINPQSAHRFSNDFLDQLVAEIDQLSALYKVSSYNGHVDQNFIDKKTQQQNPSKIVIKIPNKSQSLSNPQSLKVIKQYLGHLQQKQYQEKQYQQQNEMSKRIDIRKRKKTVEIYRPQIEDVKLLYFELKHLHLASILRNSYVILNYQPKRMPKKYFNEQVEQVLNRKKKRKPQQKTGHHNIEMDRIFPVEDKKQQQQAVLHYDSQMTGFEGDYELVGVEQIEFQSHRQEDPKKMSQFSLSTTIDLIQLEEYRH